MPTTASVSTRQSLPADIHHQFCYFEKPGHCVGFFVFRPALTVLLFYLGVESHAACLNGKYSVNFPASST
jgi:hypothetical protein